MQKNNHSFLPYFLTEPIYFVKNDFIDGAVKEDNLVDETVSSNNAEADRAQMRETDTLVKEPVQKLETNPETIKSPPVLKYSGKNLKKVLILFENPKGENIPSTQELFLGKILHAVNLNFDDVALINAAHLEDVLLEQINHFNAVIHISFGVKNQLLSFKPTTPPYKIFKDAENIFLLADDLALIEKEKEKKVLLWNNLKTLFSNP